MLLADLIKKYGVEPVFDRLVYVGCGSNDPSYFTILREYSDGTIEYVNSWQPASTNYNVEDSVVDPAGQYAYVLNSDYDELRILDVSDPLSIVDNGWNYTDATYLNRAYVLWVDFDNDIAFVKGNEYLTALDVSNPASITKLDQISSPDQQNLMVDPSYNLAFCPRYNATQGVYSYDISTPSSLPFSYEDVVTSGTYFAQPYTLAVDHTNKLMFVTDVVTDYLCAYSYIADGTMTLEQAILLTATTYDDTSGVQVDPDRKLLFVSVDKPHPDNWGIAVMDYTDPTNITELAYISLYTTVGNDANRSVTHMHWDSEWQRLLVTAYATAVYIDVSNPSSPEVLGWLTDTTHLAGARTIRPAGGFN